MSKTKHDQIAERLAKKFRSKYKRHKGIDIVTIRNTGWEFENVMTKEISISKIQDN